MTPGPLQIILILVVALLLFGGRGKISAIMGDMAKGIRSFRKGLNEEDEEKADAARLAKDSSEPIDVTPAEEKAKQ